MWIGNGMFCMLIVDCVLIDVCFDFVSCFLLVVVGVGDWVVCYLVEMVVYIGCEMCVFDEWVCYVYGVDVYCYFEIGFVLMLIDGLVVFKDFFVEWGFFEYDFDVCVWIDLVLFM